MFVDKAGNTRTGITVVCAHCRTEFVTRKSQPGRYCSTSCAQRSTQNRTAVPCAYCGKTVSRNPSQRKRSKSGFVFCDRRCKEEAQKEGKIKEILPPHYGVSKPENSYREKFLAAGRTLKCARCGYDEFPCSVEVHHKDENRQNAEVSNLVPLCANCHRSLHNNLWQLPN